MVDTLAHLHTNTYTTNDNNNRLAFFASVYFWGVLAAYFLAPITIGTACIRMHAVCAFMHAISATAPLCLPLGVKTVIPTRVLCPAYPACIRMHIPPACLLACLPHACLPAHLA